MIEIDIYARYRAQTDDLREQDGYYATTEGRHVGYRREAYHLGPYATAFLCRAAFETATGEARIPAAILRWRLPQARRLAEQCEHDEYYYPSDGQIRDVCDNVTAFVEFGERVEWTTGEPLTIVAIYSGLRAERSHLRARFFVLGKTEGRSHPQPPPDTSPGGTPAKLVAWTVSIWAESEFASFDRPPESRRIHHQCL